MLFLNWLNSKVDSCLDLTTNLHNKASVHLNIATSHTYYVHYLGLKHFCYNWQGDWGNKSNPRANRVGKHVNIDWVRGLHPLTSVALCLVLCHGSPESVFNMSKGRPYIVKLMVLSHSRILFNSWISLRNVKRGPWDRVWNGLIHHHQATLFRLKLLI